MAGISYLSDARTDGIGIHPRGLHPAPVDRVRGIEDDRSEFLLIKAQKHRVVASVVGKSSGGDNIGFIEFCTAVIVLHDWERLRQSHTRDENQPDPVMPQSVGNMVAGRLGFQLLN